MTKMTLRSNFPAVREAAHDLVRHARDEALIEGQEETQRRLGGNKQGYDLDPFVVEKENLGHQSGRIYVPEDRWYYRFFEFGTVYIQAVPFIRPAHRKMRKKFIGIMGDEFEGWVRRRVRRV